VKKPASSSFRWGNTLRELIFEIAAGWPAASVKGRTDRRAVRWMQPGKQSSTHAVVFDTLTK
jgi:hypothetical protein